MDPNTALNDIITSLMNGEFAEARHSLRILEDWRNGGGFPPQDPRPGTPQAAGTGWKARG